MCIPTSFKLEIIDSDDECARPMPSEGHHHRKPKKGKGIVREEIDIQEKVNVRDQNVSVKETVRINTKRGKEKRKKRSNVLEEVRVSTGNDSPSINEAVIVEIAPGQIARLHHRRKRPPPYDRTSERTTLSAAIRAAEYWLCPGCEVFIKMSVEICIKCGHRRQQPDCSSPKLPPKGPEPEKPSSDTQPMTTSVDVEVDVGTGKASEKVEVEVDVNTLNYERLKKLMLETGAAIAKEVLSEESRKKSPAADPPIQVPPVPQPIPYYPIVFPPPAPPSSSASTSRSSSSNVSRRSFDRMRSQVRYLSGRLSRLGDRTGVLSGNVHGLGNAVWGLDCDVQNTTHAVNGLGNEVLGIDGAVRGLENRARHADGALHHLEGQVQANTHWAAALDQRERGLASGLGSVRGRLGRVERRVKDLETPVWRGSCDRNWSRGRSRIRWDEREHHIEWLEGQRERVEDRREWVEGRRERLEDRREHVEDRRERLEDERERALYCREVPWAGRGVRWRW